MRKKGIFNNVIIILPYVFMREKKKLMIRKNKNKQNYKSFLIKQSVLCKDVEIGMLIKQMIVAITIKNNYNTMILHVFLYPIISYCLSGDKNYRISIPLS